MKRPSIERLSDGRPRYGLRLNPPLTRNGVYTHTLEDRLTGRVIATATDQREIVAACDLLSTGDPNPLREVMSEVAQQMQLMEAGR